MWSRSERTLARPVSRPPRDGRGRPACSGLPQHDYVDHDAEAAELVFLPGLVVLAELAPLAVEDVAGEGVAAFAAAEQVVDRTAVPARSEAASRQISSQCSAMSRVLMRWRASPCAGPRTTPSCHCRSAPRLQPGPGSHDARHVASPTLSRSTSRPGDPAVPSGSFTMTGTYCAAGLAAGLWRPADCRDSPGRDA